MDKVSVIVPIYNIKDYLEECLNSICNQTYADLDIILVDDGSEDGSENICDDFALKDSRIRVIHKQNEGLVRARKTGLEIAKGEYISYVDGDDWVEANMIERLYTILTNYNVDVAMCGRYEDTEAMSRPVYHGFSEGKYDKKRMMDEIYPHMIVNGGFFEWGIFPSVWDKLFKREILEKHQMMVDERITMGEDAACVYPCLLNADSIYILHECLYHYRQSVNSMVKRQRNINEDRKNFNILYHSLMSIFGLYKGIYDLREQWKDYILFLMTPRAGVLYKGIEKLDYLYPFPNVKRGSNIVLYGMGTYGQLLYGFIKRTNICNIVACADRNYIELNKQGLDVISPDKISQYGYDYIVVAHSFAKVRSAVYKDLSDKFGENKIQLIDETLIKAEESLLAFGLM